MMQHIKRRWVGVLLGSLLSSWMSPLGSSQVFAAGTEQPASSGTAVAPASDAARSGAAPAEGEATPATPASTASSAPAPDAAAAAPASTAPAPSEGASGATAPASPDTPADASQDSSLKTLSRAEWQEEYRQLNELVQRYDEGVQYFKKDVDEIVERKRSDELERIQQTYDSRYLKLVDELRVRREQAVAAFERFIQKYPDSEHTPMAMFRLAELYFDESSYAYMEAQDNYSKLLKELKDDAEAPAEPKQDFAKSLALYDRIIKEFPNFKYIDGVYYMRGYLFGTETAQQFDAEQSKQAWEELIKRRPDSVYASQAYLRIGEYFFEKDTPTDIGKAIEYYLKVMSYQDKWKDRALYKIAWSHYRLSDYRRAISYFVELLDFSQSQFEETGQESDLRSEALEYLAISFEDAGNVENALKIFEEIGERSYKKEVLKRLAQMYVIHAKFEEGIDTYTRLQELFPSNSENPVFQEEIIKIYERSGDLASAINASETLKQRYSPDSDWWQKNNQQKAAQSKAQELVQSRLKNLAFYYNDLADKATKDTDRLRYYTMAAEKYSEFLVRFPYAKEAYEMQYFYGDCLFWSGQFEMAARQYDKAMTYTEAKYHTDAARGMVESFENLIKQKEGADGVDKPFTVAAEEAPEATELTPEQKAEYEACPEVVKNPGCVKAQTRPVSLSSLKKRYIDAIDILAKVAPGETVTPTYRFKAAMIYFYHEQYEVSEKRLRELIDQYADKDVAVKGAQFIVDGLVNQKKWGDVIAAVDGFKGKTLGPDSRGWNQVLSKLLDIQTKARPLEAACDCNIEAKIQKFLALNTDFGYINAARLQEKLGRVDDALKSYQILISQFPKSEYLEDALFRTASNYEKFLDLQKAIDSYERIVVAFPRSEKASICAYNVAFLYQGLKELRKSARAYESYASNYSDQEDAEFAYFTAGGIYIRMEDWNEVIRVSKEYIRRYSTTRVHADRMISAHVRIIEAFDKLSKPKDSMEWEKKVPVVVSALRESPTYTPYGTGLYAKIVFRDMPRMLDALNSIKFGSKPEQISKQLDRKIELVKQLDAKMQEVVRLGNVDYATAAFFTAGLGYQTFADDLRNAVPEGLDDEGMELFQQMIDEYAGPLEDKALELYRRNLDIEEKQGIWNEWIEKTYAQLYILMPSDYPARKKEKIDFSLGEQSFAVPTITSIPAPDGT